MADSSLGECILYLIPRNHATLQALQASMNKNRLTEIKDNQLKQTKAIVLSFTVPPKDISKGFVFGGGPSCDIGLPGKDVSDRHFAVTFNPSTGIPLVENKSSRGVSVRNRVLAKPKQTRVIENDIVIYCGGFELLARFPDRGKHQVTYADKLGKYLGYLIASAPAVIKSAYATPINPRKRIGVYLELKKLGSGGFGDVCQFADSRDGKVFAVKRFKNPKEVKDIEREISTLRQLDHKNIVRFVDNVCENDGSLCLIMEYLPHGNLCDFKISKHGDIVEVLRQCLEGLAYIHSHGIMHRDIKPDNIVLKSTFPIQANLVDFGLARECIKATSKAGTMMYLAPEIWDGQSYTHVIDIWALGLTGLSLFKRLPVREGENFLRSRDPGLLRVYISAIQAACKQLPPHFSEFLRGMLDPAPKTRWSAKKCLEQTGKVQHCVGKPGKVENIHPVHNPHQPILHHHNPAPPPPPPNLPPAVAAAAAAFNNRRQPKPQFLNVPNFGGVRRRW